MSRLLWDLRCAVKIWRGAWAGYAGLQWKDHWGDWHDIAHDPTTGQWEVADRSYYVCVAWHNWTHTPLPIVAGWGSASRVQRLAARILHWICWPDMVAAVADCRSYQEQARC